MSQPQNPAKTGLRFTLASTSMAVRKALGDTLAGLQHLNLSDEECGTVELVLAEVMNNIVEHAYADNPDGIIELQIRPCKTGLQCTVLDDGQPMPDGIAPTGDYAMPGGNIGNLPEGGFGWFLIRNMAQDIDYKRVGQKNQLNFRIAVGSREFSRN